MLAVSSVKIILPEHWLFFEQSFCESVVFSLNSVGFFFSHSQVETLRLEHPCWRMRLSRLSGFDSGQTTPLAWRDLYEFAEQNLVVFANHKVFLWDFKILGASFIQLEFLQLFSNCFCDFGSSNCLRSETLTRVAYAPSCDLLKLLLMNAHLAVMS